ncbi:hypothetical protein I4U23_005216 [Adineta vaga]|nr:hypothetical protein I4U23_005216 [Adineta vaga]
MVGANNVGICAFLYTFCAELELCGPSLKCSDRSHLCIHHSRCGDRPRCYPSSMIDRNLCPPIQSIMNTTMTTSTITSTSTNMSDTTTGSPLVYHNSALEQFIAENKNQQFMALPFNNLTDQDMEIVANQAIRDIVREYLLHSVS